MAANPGNVIKFIRKNDANAEAVASAAANFVQEATPANSRNFFIRCDKEGLWGGDIAFASIKELLRQERADIVSKLCEDAGESSPHRGIYCAGQALLDLKNADTRKACSHLRESINSIKNSGLILSCMDDLMTAVKSIEDGADAESLYKELIAPNGSGQGEPAKQSGKARAVRGIFNDPAKLDEFIGNNVSRSDKCREAVVGYAQASGAFNLLQTFQRWQKARPSTWSYIVYDSVYHLVLADEDETVNRLLSMTEESSRLFGLFNLGRAFIECKKWEIEQCAHYLREGLWHCLKEKLSFSDLDMAIKNISLMETIDRPISARATPEPFTVIKEEHLDSPYALSLCASPLYFETFFDARIKNIKERCGDANILLTLVNPTDGIIARACDEPSVRAIYRTNLNEAGLSEAMSLTCSKIGEYLLDVYPMPRIFIELDSLYPEGIGDIFDFMSRQSLVYHENKNELYPSLRMDGACSCIRSCEETKAFSGTIIDYMAESLARETPVYLFDQLALFRAIIKAKKSGFNMTEIDEFTGDKGGFRHFFKAEDPDHVLPFETRGTMRRNDYKPVGMTEDRRILWTVSG